MTKDQEKWLQWFAVHGGDGYVDRYGRVVVGGERSHQMTQATFMRLIAMGHISGADDRLKLTEKGLAWAKENC